jgi:hypothetical protein
LAGLSARRLSLCRPRQSAACLQACFRRSIGGFHWQAIDRLIKDSLSVRSIRCQCPIIDRKREDGPKLRPADTIAARAFSGGFVMPSGADQNVDRDAKPVVEIADHLDRQAGVTRAKRGSGRSCVLTSKQWCPMPREPRNIGASVRARLLDRARIERSDFQILGPAAHRHTGMIVPMRRNFL